ncbi:MAG: cation diffusion facilitator family transporter [Candidatus Nanoarchaeia archaeon]
MSPHHNLDKEFSSDFKALIFAIFLTATIFLVELIGGFLTKSLALMSDAGHMLTDLSALGLALFALWFSKLPSTKERTYGFYRAEVLAALFNSSLLIFIAGYIFYEAFQRVLNPPIVRGGLMLFVAVVGLIANILGIFLLSKGSKKNINIKAAFWHVVSDALSSLGVIAGGLIIIFSRFYIIDPIIGFVIGIVILRGALNLLFEAIDILLEATPKDIDIEKIVDEFKKVEGVLDVHDLHIWTISSGMRAFSAHILIEDSLVSKCADISKSLKRILSDKFNIMHATLEYECESCSEGAICTITRR